MTNALPAQPQHDATRMLVVAYACAPGKGSEWGAGWAFVREVSRSHPVWVVTHADNREAIESQRHTLADHHPVHFEYVALPRVLSWMRDSAYALLNVHYYLWQFAARSAVLRLHERVRFTLAQHVSLMRWWMPSAASVVARRGAKFIFGPVVGGELTPKNFRAAMPLKARLGELQRWIAREIWRHDPLLKRCVRDADLVLAGIPAAYDQLKRLGARRLELISSGTMSADEIVSDALAARASLDTARPFTVVSAGGLSYYRGVDLCLRAFAHANLPDARYVHACEGPDRARLEALARTLGIASRVHFTGDQPHAMNVRTVASAHVLMHTVLRDSMGLMPEAMAMGIPVLCLNLNTMALMVNESVGHRVKIDHTTTAEQIVERLAAVLRRWHDDPAERARLGVNAIEHAKQFTQAARAAQFRAFHQSVLHAARDNASAAPTRPAAPAKSITELAAPTPL